MIVQKPQSYNQAVWPLGHAEARVRDIRGQGLKRLGCLYAGQGARDGILLLRHGGRAARDVRVSGKAPGGPRQAHTAAERYEEL